MYKMEAGWSKVQSTWKTLIKLVRREKGKETGEISKNTGSRSILGNLAVAEEEETNIHDRKVTSEQHSSQ